MKSAHFEFRQPLSVSDIDQSQKIIKGVAVMTGGLEAKGHKLQVDETTIDQVVELGKKAGKVQVKYNHRSGVEDIAGYLFNFRKVGLKAVADWQLLDSHAETQKTLEKAAKMPECFGLSAAFNGPEKGEVINKKNYARVTSLEAVDCVPNPAANPTGLFEAKIDNGDGENQTHMPPTNTNTTQEPDASTKAILDAINKISERLDTIESRMEGETPLSKEELEELSGLTDEQLSEAGITRADVDAALAATTAPAAPGGPDGGATAPNASASAPTSQASATAATALSIAKSAMAAVHRFQQGQQAQIELAEAKQVETAFETLESKITELSELCATKDTQITALQNQLRSRGVSAAAPGRETTRLFSAKDGDGSHQFETNVTTIMTEAAKANKPVSRSAAIALAIKQDPQAYEAYRNAGRE